MTYCLDTNYVIEYYQKGGLPVIENTAELAISRVTYLEYLSFAEFEEEEIARIKRNILEDFKIIELNELIADYAAYCRRRFSGLRSPDSIVLATAVMTRSTLLTYDNDLHIYYQRL